MEGRVERYLQRADDDMSGLCPLGFGEVSVVLGLDEPDGKSFAVKERRERRPE